MKDQKMTKSKKKPKVKQQETIESVRKVEVLPQQQKTKRLSPVDILIKLDLIIKRIDLL